ncbi:hypothetical protein ENUP19_0388G0007 [Entamoeba nuttalli]|uniref:Uncharacterized protein n=2 Tax=Entamoeba nuttalli TaxID=412467 RepID=K2H713_ENTNP|nr:hypothetical protein ENU1_024180 [Entamoeba nuttalli P19]EKE42347.1 hypothetical protein ENU1_024180 [Entamoeba nuttalli P19]|eukprot:XP_008855322.1 hypothetical protein ENU1_024180 [Entamoeba nuttalli P19]
MQSKYGGYLIKEKSCESLSASEGVCDNYYDEMSCASSINELSEISEYCSADKEVYNIISGNIDSSFHEEYVSRCENPGF